MPDTIPHLELDPDPEVGYINVNEATGIPVGTAITMQNLSTDYAFIVRQTAQPLIDANNYDAFPPDGSLTGTICADENIIWIKGRGRFSVQVT